MFRTIFSSKYTTAIITNSANKVYLVPIKYTIGDYFVVELNKTFHVFKIDGSQIKHFEGYRKKVFTLIFYDTRHYKPLNAKTAELEQILKENSLPKVNSTLAKVFKVLGGKEKKNFSSHEITDLIKDLSELKKNKQKQSTAMKEGYVYDDKLANVVNFLKSLNTDTIVTPLKSISEYVQEELITTDPAFMGTVISTYQRTDIQHKILSNTASLGKMSLMKIMLSVVLVGAIGVSVYIMYDMGLFSGNNPLSSFIPSLNPLVSNVPFDLSNDAFVQQRYPTGESLKNAIDSGVVNYDDLSPAVQGMVDSLE